MAKKKEMKAASLNPNRMAEGGGLLDNIRAIITSATFVIDNYGGKGKMKKPLAHLIIEETDGTVHEDQWWSCGKLEDWSPSEDGIEPSDSGEYLIPVGVKSAIHKSTNFGMLMSSLLDAGFPEDKLDASIKCLEGLEAHFAQVATGRDKKKSADGTKEYEDTALCVVEIFKYPWEKKGAKSGGKSKSTGGGESSAKAKDDGAGSEAGSDLSAATEELVMELLMEADGELAKKNIAPKIMMARKGKDVKETKEMIALANDADWLGAEDKSWNYENGIISM